VQDPVRPDSLIRALGCGVIHPLLCIVLAVQNMAASGTVAQNQEIEFTALKGSLTMMSKGTYDVLITGN
jgi:hypothetical protein